MRIKGLWCKCVHGEVSINHYERGECTSPPAPIPRLRAILKWLQADKMHRDGIITATRTLTCPRKIILEDEFDHVIQLMNFNAPYEGTREHKDMAEHAPAGQYSEVVLPPEGAPPVEMFGVPLRGTSDLVHSDFSRIDDYKKHSEWSQKYKHTDFELGRIAWEDAAQENIYRILIARSVLKVADDDFRPILGIWHGTMPGSKGPPPWFYVEMPIMTEQEIANLRPFDSKYTVQQNVDAIKGYYERRRQGVSKEESAKKVILAGRDMFRNKKTQRGTMCDRYCAARPVCDKVEGISTRY